MADQFDIVEVTVDDVQPGDVLAVTDDVDPRPNAFHVASVEFADPVETGQMRHITLTSAAVGDQAAMVLDYPPGTVLRKIV